MYFYALEPDKVLVSYQKQPEFAEIPETQAGSTASVCFAVDLPPGLSRARWKADCYSLQENYLETLDSVLFNKYDDADAEIEYADRERRHLPEWLARKQEAGHLTAVNLNYDSAINRKQFMFGGHKRINIVGLGDVGGTLAIGLRLLGDDCVSKIGLFGGGNAQSEARWHYELNQILDPANPDGMPEVHIVSEEQLFDCDIFVFCASGGVPPLGSECKDVRLVQYEANAAIIEKYAKMARTVQFSGLFAVVSDPVDLLCAKVFASSNRDEAGNTDLKGLLPEQIQGYGLGVMYARGAYYAQINGCRDAYIKSGRAFGPHGEGLIIVNSMTDYDDTLSSLLTEQTVHANLAVRETGFKPFIAPAMSSGAISILRTIRGDWHYSSTFINGAFLGARNRFTQHGIEVERISAPPLLKEKIAGTYMLVREMSEKCCK